MIGAAAVQRTLVFVGAAGTMSSLQSLRELISERLAAAAEEICRLCEGTIVQYEQELCRQRRLLDICWKPQLQLHNIVLPQHWVTEEKDLYNQQRNFRDEKENLEPPQVKEEPEHLQIEEEQDKFSISHNEEQLDVKQETETLMEIHTNKENEFSDSDLNSQQSFDETDSQDDKSTSTADEETEPQNRDQRKTIDKSHIQSVDFRHISEGQCESDVRKRFEMASLGEECIQSTIDKRLSSVESNESSMKVNNLYVCLKTRSDEIVYVCKECKKGFHNLSQFIFHIKIHREERSFPCKECDKKFTRNSALKSHMRSHTGERPFTCEKCGKSFSKSWIVRRHMEICAKQKLITCKDYDGVFGKMSSLKKNLETHPVEKLFTCIECNTSFNHISHLKIHMRTHAGFN